VTKLFAFAANSDPSGVADIAHSPVFNAFIARAEGEYRRLSPTPDGYRSFLSQIEKMWESQPQWTAADLRKITVPTWIVDADHDEAIKRENQERLEAERKAQLVAQQERTRQEAHQRFIAQASDATAFPTLASMFEKNPRWKGQIISEATQILREAKQKTGEDYSNKQVLLYLEEKYSEITPSRNGAVTREDTGKTTPGTATTAGGSRTLTNDATQVRGTLPPDFDSLSDAEQKKALAALYRQTSRK